jgi:hypothetical protein
MKKAIIFSLFVYSLSFSKEIDFYNYYPSVKNKDVIKDFNQWQDEVTDLEIKSIERKVKLLEAESKLQDEELKIKYKDAIFYDFTQNQTLKRDLIRAKIYYYYHNGHPRYYYFNQNWKPIFIN